MLNEILVMIRYHLVYFYKFTNNLLFLEADKKQKHRFRAMPLRGILFIVPCATKAKSEYTNNLLFLEAHDKQKYRFKVVPLRSALRFSFYCATKAIAGNRVRISFGKFSFIKNIRRN